jgi:hypothetical protein
MEERMRKAVIAGSVAVLAGLLMAVAASAGSQGFVGNLLGPSTVAVFGDTPYGASYGDTKQLVATPELIAAINADPSVSLALHVGDIHAGSDHCGESYNQKVLGLWQGTLGFADPLVYTPGDNEWSDCQKQKEGGWTFNDASDVTQKTCTAFSASTACDGYVDPTAAGHLPGDPVDNLALVRKLFFPTPGVTLGAKKLVLSQATLYDRAHPTDAQYVENVIWVQSRTMFVTVNIPGGSNNDKDVWYAANKNAGKAWPGGTTETDRQREERENRTAADIRWLDTAFTLARAAGLKAVVIGTQADMWDNDGAAASHLDGYTSLVQDIAANTKAFGKPVLLFNGDSHDYVSDNPLATDQSTVSQEVGDINKVYGATTPLPLTDNFHRVVVHGKTLVGGNSFEWLRLSIDPSLNAAASANAFGPFTWEEKLVPIS